MARVCESAGMNEKQFIKAMQAEGWQAENASGDVVKSPRSASRLWTKGNQRFEGGNTFINHLGRERKAWQILADAGKTGITLLLNC